MAPNLHLNVFLPTLDFGGGKSSLRPIDGVVFGPTVEVDSSLNSQY